jgi:hypothetical protein
MEAFHEPKFDRYFTGLDLGQSQDFSAIVTIVRRRYVDENGRYVAHKYTVKGLKRWPLGTTYKSIAEDVRIMFDDKPLSASQLGIDATGVGKAVVELVRGEEPKAAIIPIVITAGHVASYTKGECHVPKKDLVAVVTSVLQRKLLAIPKSLPESTVLRDELVAFKAKITNAGNMTFEADWRSRQHDDVVLATA